MSNQYVSKLENGAYRVAGTRISLDSVVYGFWRGESPESIVDSFPDLTLEQVFGAIAYYLAKLTQCCTGNWKKRDSRRCLYETSVPGGCRFEPAHCDSR